MELRVGGGEAALHFRHHERTFCSLYRFTKILELPARTASRREVEIFFPPIALRTEMSTSKPLLTSTPSSTHEKFRPPLLFH